MTKTKSKSKQVQPDVSAFTEPTEEAVSLQNTEEIDDVADDDSVDKCTESVRMPPKLLKAAKKFNLGEIRSLVYLYYMSQENRKRTSNQERALIERGETYAHISWLRNNARIEEREIGKALKIYVESSPILGQWCLSIDCVSHVLAAGLMAHIDPDKAHTASSITRFAGVDPTRKWIGAKEAKYLVKKICEEHPDEDLRTVVVPKVAAALNVAPDNLLSYFKTRGKPLTETNLSKAASLCPWNATLKTLVYKLGNMFAKSNHTGVRGKPNSFYVQEYVKRLAYEQAKNASGGNAAAAAEMLVRVPRHKQASIYKQGKLPELQVYRRAERYTAKMFLNHYYEVMCVSVGRLPRRPYILEHPELGDHTKYIPVHDPAGIYTKARAELEKKLGVK